MTPTVTHPVHRLTDDALRELFLRVDATGFPSDLHHLWNVERTRYRETIARIPPAEPSHALLDLGSTRAWLPFYQLVLGYGRIVLNTKYPDSGFVDEGIRVRGAPDADVSVSVFDVERAEFPHDDATFDVVLCLEVLEHLSIDPMAMMSEVHRVLKPGGTFVLTSPNAVRTSNIVNAILGEQPYGWAPYNGFDTNRHNREYTPSEVERLFQAAGITPREVTTFGLKRRGSARDLLRAFVSPLLWPIRSCPPQWRRDVILAVGTNTMAVVERRPSWLYFDMAERARLDRQPVPDDSLTQAPRRPTRPTAATV